LKKPIFITARFRSGSTLLWNIYRNASGAHAYYEPLHEQLPELISLDVAPQSRHYFVDSYFTQYPEVESLKKFHSVEFGIHRLLLENHDEHPDLQNYINYLISYAVNNDRAVLQFNRVDFRLPWIKKNFTEAVLVHLYRNPRDQWLSTIQDYPGDIDNDMDGDPYRITTWSRDLIKQFPFLSTPYIYHPYQRHYYLWKLSYLMGKNLSDYSIAYENILADPESSIQHLLELGQLDTRKNIEQCLKIIVKRPVNSWKTYRDEKWFEEMEQECESQLTALGLNQSFGLQPLEQIVAQNSQYQNMMADARPADWATKSSQVAIIKLMNSADEKEKIIDELKDYQENVIHNFRTNPKFWLVNGPFLPIARKFLTPFKKIRRIFLSKLGVLTQYPPRPLYIPAAYTQTSTSLSDVSTISIVTPSYNQAVFIERTLRSVLEQGYPRLEYVVQDGNSTDHTVDILDQYKDRLTNFESCRDHGQANAINMGFEHTSGSIMAYLNSDDVLLPGSLNYVANYFQLHPEVDVIYSHRVIIDTEDHEVGRWLMPKHDNQVLYWADYVPQETLFWRRQIWEKAGGRMDESYKFALDWDLLLRFQESGAVIHRVSRFLAAFRIHEAQKTATHINLVGIKEMQKLRKQYLGRHITNEEVFRNIKSYLNQSVIYQKLYALGLYKA